MIDDDEPQEFAELDDAIAAALEMVDEGGVVAVHDADCELDDDGDEERCTCTPLELRKGAKA